ncbi:hypothetical protein [Dysgonomonas sp. ZJ279]|uniref:hypothetical protein n=1 Tax=Dysgonomonas sp. ZJ279 TaxID=2709796 RepID=UPI0013EC1E4B|nr:hypothetical protein [Dysgonomonas sp. ZJ279]
MNKTATKKPRNPHGWLFLYLQSVCDIDDTEAARKVLVNQYSGGKTESLTTLFKEYPNIYNKMRTDLSPAKPKESDNILDKPRKRLMAALFEMLENKEKEKPKDKQRKITTEYVKAVACRAAKVDRFNNIQLPTLKALYRSIGEKNMKEWDNLIKDLLNGII